MRGCKSILKSSGISGAFIGMGIFVIVIVIVVGLASFILSLVLLIGANKVSLPHEWILWYHSSISILKMTCDF